MALFDILRSLNLKLKCFELDRCITTAPGPLVTLILMFYLRRKATVMLQECNLPTVNSFTRQYPEQVLLFKPSTFIPSAYSE